LNFLWFFFGVLELCWRGHDTLAGQSEGVQALDLGQSATLTSLTPKPKNKSKKCKEEKKRKDHKKVQNIIEISFKKCHVSTNHPH